ncbi:HupE/UreJ family protein [Streptomyces justiciae]|uniref:HupE/UreJ family protein n=1 Tax=Streptomyces justiciae TaxID=2780140 RepID=A0ABU3M7R8_9ACTN|nr:HupE/UreJ family protein [Streptomyces justiciae]MDT7846723.1 HupE/UreJ family protein [Streptomyces justiciae]
MRRLLPALVITVLTVFLLAGGLASPAGAHPMSTSAVLLDIGDDRVEGEVRLPLDRLSVAVHRDLTRANVLGADRVFLKNYTAGHIAAAADDGRSWGVTLGTGSVRTIDGTPHLVYPLELRPPDGQVTDFRLRYDVIVEELLTHRIFVTVRYDFDRGILKTDDAETLGVLDHETQSLDVPAGQGSWLRGFATTAGLGIEHVGSGADHLLFLLMLLLPAPLTAAGGRWRAAAPSARRSVVRVVHVVTAFAIGHSLTLAAAAAGLLDVPSRPVETLIALSIAVSAVHAVRPLAARGEVLIAAGFGLVHGLAFASLIGDLGLARGSLVTTLLGFNLGIELTQLLVVALLMPSLAVLAGTGAYTAFRVGVAGVGLVFSVSWMLERAGLTPADPFEGVQTWLVENPLLIASAVAVLALAARRPALVRLRR